MMNNKTKKIFNFSKNNTRDLIIVLVLVLVITIAFNFEVNSSFRKCACQNNKYPGKSDKVDLAWNARWIKPVNIYIIGTADTTGKAEKILHELGLNVRTSDKLDKSGIEWADVILIHSNWFKSIGPKYKSQIIGIIRSGKPLASYGFDAGNRLVEFVGKTFFLNELTLSVGEEPHSNKTPNLELPVEVKLFAIVAHGSQGHLLVPDYLVIVRDIEDLEKDAVNLINWLVDLGVIGGMKEHHSITVNGFRYVGSISWKFYYIKYCGNSVGDLQVRSKYYYHGEKIGGVFYKWFLIYVNHLTTGYSDATWCGACPYANWAFYKAITKIDGHTDTFPGQVFDDMGPKNARTCVNSISYVVSAGVNGPPPSGAVSASVSVSYNPNQISYTSIVNTATGVVKWTHSPCQHATDTTWWVEPSAIFYLDPTKDFGYEPLVITHYYYSKIKGYTTPQCGGTAYAYKQASYTAYVKSTGVSQG